VSVEKLQIPALPACFDATKRQSSDKSTLATVKSSKQVRYNLRRHAPQLPHWVGQTLDTLVENGCQHLSQSWQLHSAEPVRWTARLTAWQAISQLQLPEQQNYFKSKPFDSMKIEAVRPKKSNKPNGSDNKNEIWLSKILVSLSANVSKSGLWRWLPVELLSSGYYSNGRLSAGR